MKLSVVPVSLYKSILNGEMSLVDWVEIGKSIGLDAVDVSILMLKQRDSDSLSRLSDVISSMGMELAVASTYPDFTHPEPIERERQKKMFAQDLIDLAKIGTRRIRITSGQAHPSVSREEGLNWATEAITGFVPLAEEHHVKLVFENHSKPGVWEYPDFNFPTDIFLELTRRLEGYPIGLLFDCANPIAYGEEPLPLLEKIVDRTVCIHASETIRKGELVPALAGTGLVPFREIFSFLKSREWDGILSIEEASNRGVEGITSAVDNIRELWEKA